MYTHMHAGGVDQDRRLPLEQATEAAHSSRSVGRLWDLPPAEAGQHQPSAVPLLRSSLAETEGHATGDQELG